MEFEINKNSNPINSRKLKGYKRLSRNGRMSFRGRNQVASSRYFVPSGTWRRDRDDDALRHFVVRTSVSTVTTKGGGHGVGDNTKLEERSCSGFKIENCAVKSALPLYCSLSSSFFFVFRFLSRIASWTCTYTRVKRDARASVRWRQIYRSPCDETPLTAWPCSRSNASSFRSHFHSLCAASSLLSFLFFCNAAERKLPREDWGFIHLPHRYLLGITSAPSAFLSFLFPRSLSIYLFFFDMSLRAASLFRHFFFTRLLHHRSYKTDGSCLVTRPCRPPRSFTIH